MITSTIIKFYRKSITKAVDFFKRRTIASLFLLFFAGISIAAINMIHLSSELINTQALQSSFLYADALQQARTLYNEAVVDKLKNEASVNIDYNHFGQPKTIPFPATFLIELSERISQENLGLSVKLFSDHPFASRKNPNRRDPFEREALAFLVKNPDQPYTKIMNVNGRKVFRYAQAEIMKSSCVACHNSHPQSTKRDWKVGDVRGGLEITSSIDFLVQQNRKGILSGVAMISGLFGLAGIGVWIVFDRLKKVSVELEEKVKIRTQELSQANESLSIEQEKSNSLLLNILPKPIVERLEGGEKNISDAFAGVSILFADIVNFTPLSQRVQPAELVEILNRIFCKFDDLSAKYGLEKIKTIGDCYMVASGLPEACPDHASRIASMALSMQDVIRTIGADLNIDLDIRIGINSGPVVAGVIGKKKFVYDLWGDTVNVASRMESHAVNGSIQVSETTYQLLKSNYLFEQRGMIAIKGKGEMKAYILKSKINPIN
ncbi:MAG: adenylate/guanylate cyclase domain-containing protein [Cyanobacteria bacterium REEB417]|nr:adenylate/guanylate cyclase domain-containing protein [Cyanobacteria bacterium REEB417]